MIETSQELNALSVRLQRARKAAGLSLREAAILAGVSHAAIKKYEEGSTPSSEILLKLAKAYKVRIEYFFRPEIQRLESVKFRKRKLGVKKLGMIENVILDQVERRLEIEELCPHHPFIKSFERLEGLPTIENLDQIEDVAVKIRERWHLGLAPITNLVDILEENGIRVFIINSRDEKFDGLAGTVGNGIPIIVVDASWPGDRQRFTLSHELGHLVLAGHVNASLEEKTSNRFAGAFLLPKDVAIQEIGSSRTSLQIREMAMIKEEYGISIFAQYYRLRDLGIISENVFTSLIKYYRKQGWSSKEPGEPYPSEKVRIFEHMVLYALSEGIIGESKAAELLNRTTEDFRLWRTSAYGNAIAC